MKPFILGSASRLRTLTVIIALDNDAGDCTSRLFTSSDRKLSNLLLQSLLRDL